MSIENSTQWTITHYTISCISSWSLRSLRPWVVPLSWNRLGGIWTVIVRKAPDISNNTLLYHFTIIESSISPLSSNLWRNSLKFIGLAVPSNSLQSKLKSKPLSTDGRPTATQCIKSSSVFREKKGCTQAISHQKSIKRAVAITALSKLSTLETNPAVNRTTTTGSRLSFYSFPQMMNSTRSIIDRDIQDAKHNKVLNMSRSGPMFLQTICVPPWTY